MKYVDPQNPIPMVKPSDWTQFHGAGFHAAPAHAVIVLTTEAACAEMAEALHRAMNTWEKRPDWMVAMVDRLEGRTPIFPSQRQEPQK